ncbi:MAG: hypothetical protein AAF928_10830 [Myxococcota bacterium]
MARIIVRNGGAAVPLLVVALSAGGCGEGKRRSEQMLAEASATASGLSSPAAPASAASDPTVMPTLLVDEEGIVVGPTRVKDLKTEARRAEVAAAVADLPYASEPVRVRALKKARTPMVAELVWQLGKAGAKSIVVVTDVRDDLPGEITLTPETSLSGDEVPSCSVVAMVTASADTGVWALRGGGGRKHRKGFAGPDLSSTEETMKKDIKSCDSPIALFSAAENMPWKHAFSMGALLKQADEEGVISSLVLLGREPVAGRAVALRQ